MKKILWCEMPQSYNDEFKTVPTREGMIPPGSKFVITALERRSFAVDVRLWDEIEQPSDHDVVMVAIMFVRQYPNLPELFHRLGMDPYKAARDGRVPIIAGGHGIHNPVPLAPLFDRIVLGDGETIAGDLAEDIDAWDDSPHVWPNKVGFAKKYNEPCSTLISRQYGQRVAFIEIARGCRSKCAFCELGWTHAYREADRSDVFGSLRELPRGTHINFLAPDAASWPHYSDAIEEAATFGLLPKFNSMRIDTSSRQWRTSHTCRFGVEGASERLRELLWKPYRHSEIEQRLREVNADGVYGIKLFYLSDLPWTTRDDYEEFMRFWQWFSLPKGGKITIKFTGHLPQPGTPMQNAPKPLRKSEYVFLSSLQAGGKTKRETARPGLSGTALYILPIQSLERQALETYFLRAGEEMFGVVCQLAELGSKLPSLARLSSVVGGFGIDISRMLDGQSYGCPVTPVHEWKKQITFKAKPWGGEHA